MKVLAEYPESKPIGSAELIQSSLCGETYQELEKRLAEGNFETCVLYILHCFLALYLFIKFSTQESQWLEHNLVFSLNANP